MKLAIINGSPRGERGNSIRIAGFLTKDLARNPQCSVELFHLAKVKEHTAMVEKLGSFDRYVFIFPLYTDCMPGIVKAFMEKMAEKPEYFKTKSIAYIVHSGFPEPVQSRVLARYTKYFSNKVMEMNYLGTLIFPGSEALQMAPDKLFQNKFTYFSQAFKDIIENQVFSDELLTNIAGKEGLTKFAFFLIKFTPLPQFYWYYTLLKNKAFFKRKAKPYSA